MKQIAIILTIFLSMTAAAQTPVANRVKAMEKTLQKGAESVAKYTDNKRHCLYYTFHNRLYRYDVMTNKRENVEFATDAYNKIKATMLSPDGNFVFVIVDRGDLANFYLSDGQQLWRIDSRNLKSTKIGEGYDIKKNDKDFVIKKAHRCLNPNASRNAQKWTARDHHFDLTGHVLFASDEYKIK